MNPSNRLNEIDTVVYSVGMWPEIWKGLIVGVGAGVTTAIILGSLRWLFRMLDRRNQITYLRDLILNHRENILSEGDMPIANSAGRVVSGDLWRFMKFRELQSGLKAAVSTRTSALTYKEVSSLETFLEHVDRAMKDINLESRQVLPLLMSQDFYDQLQSLSWLRLPGR